MPFTELIPLFPSKVGPVVWLLHGRLLLGHRHLEPVGQVVVHHWAVGLGGSHKVAWFGGLNRLVLLLLVLSTVVWGSQLGRGLVMASNVRGSHRANRLVLLLLKPLVVAPVIRGHKGIGWLLLLVLLVDILELGELGQMVGQTLGIGMGVDKVVRGVRSWG